MGDYNHFFDLHAMLFSLTQAHEWKVALLVDEAHNLVERARRIYGAELRQISLVSALATFKSMSKTPKPLVAALNKAPTAPKRSLQVFLKVWKQLNDAHLSPLKNHDGEREALQPLLSAPIQN